MCPLLCACACVCLGLPASTCGVTLQCFLVKEAVRVSGTRPWTQGCNPAVPGNGRHTWKRNLEFLIL